MYNKIYLKKKTEVIQYLFVFILFVFFNQCKNPSLKTVPYLSVPEGFTIEEVVSPDLISYPMFASFDDRGRLFVFESTEPNTMGTENMLKEPSYHIRMLEDSNRDGKFDKSHIYADKLPLPMGGAFYQGSLYVAAAPNLLKLTDTDGDGVVDQREEILSGWVLNSNAATLSGPFIGPDGWLYMADARRGFDIQSKEGMRFRGSSTRIWRSLPDGSRLEPMSGGGFDNSIEIAFMPSGETLGTMTYFTDPRDGQRDALMHWVEGGVYPKPHQSVQDDDLMLTGDLMPVMTKLPRVAPSGLMRYEGEGWGIDYTGNLFSAEFNTGRIMRHILERDGASYKTIDEPFMTASAPDMHPTDVLEDADGSLLVLLTGGWFIEGCPLSRVAKPDVPGGIYRIRKKGAVNSKDVWGKKIDFKDASAEELVSLVADKRMMVKKQAIESLVVLGDEAVDAIAKGLDAKEEEVRTSLVFILSRIGTASALGHVRIALTDTSAMVRTAAARSVGLARDKASLLPLMELVRNDKDLGVVRQSATALGQLEDKKAVSALLEASSSTSDRFVEHAIIYSLASLGDVALLDEALNANSSQVQRAALVALDQMEDSPLQSSQLSPFLYSKDSELLNTAIWVASHRPEWSDVVIEFFGTRLQNLEMNEQEESAMLALMVTFSTHQNFQLFISSQLSSSRIPLDRKLLLMQVIEQYPGKDIPSVWSQELRKQLQSADIAVQSAALSLVESRRITSLHTELNSIIQSASAADVRLKALSAKLATVSELNQGEFKFVSGCLSTDHASPIRQLASRLLVRASLNTSQLLELADQYIPESDLILLPNLVDAFQGNKEENVGLSLVNSLNKVTDRLDNLSEQDLEKLFSNYPEKIKAKAEPLMHSLRERHAGRLARLEEIEASLRKGDVAKGRNVFFGKSACWTCHTVGTEGSNFGPDLTNIGDIRSRHDILEAIVYPSASFAREYETHQVITKSNIYTGVIAEQLADAIIITVGPGPGIRVPRSEITAIEPHNISMMPPGLDQQLSNEELSDLMTFLGALPYTIDRMLEE